MTETLTTPLSDRARRFLDAPRFMTVATIDPDGSPHVAIVWYRIEPDGRVLLNSVPGRRWPTNLLRDGRLAMMVLDPNDGYSRISLKGVVDQVVNDVEKARDDIIALAHRYHPEGPSAETISAFRRQDRISFLVRITRVNDQVKG